MIVLFFIALALVVITAVDANIQPGSARSSRSQATGRRNPRRVTPRRRSHQTREREGLSSRQIWSF